MKSTLYSELKLKIIFITLVVSIGPLVFLGGTIFYEFAGLCEERAKDQIHQLSRSQASALDVFLRERANILSTMVDTIPFEELSRQNHLARIFASINRRSDGLGLVDMGVIDGEGNHLAYVGPYSLKGLNYNKQPWFAEVMARGKYISDMYMGFRRLPHFIIAVRGQHEGTPWVLRATIDSEVFNSLVRAVQIGQTGDAYIVNGNGIYQTTPRFRGDILESSDLPVGQFGNATLTDESVSPSGKKTYYSGTWLSNKEWLLVVSQETCDEKGRLIKIRNDNIFTVAMGCLGILLATIITTHMMVRKLEENEEKLGVLNAQLIQSDKLAAMGKMAAGIAHEINNPLAVIGEKAGWMMDLLEDEEFRESESYKEYVSAIEKIEHHVERARKITHDMLGFARRMEPHLDNIDLNDVVNQTISILESYARTNNIDIQTDLSDALPVVSIDHAQIQQVFLNLLTNAIDAIGKDGRIDVKTRKIGSRIHISVQDDGPGIPEAKQKNVFDPFYTTKQPGEGTGLGLSISYNIVEKMGGTVHLQSKVGKGTTFIIELPIVTPERQ